MGIFRGQSGAGSEHTGGREGAEDTASPGLRDPLWVGCRHSLIQLFLPLGGKGSVQMSAEGLPSCCGGHGELGAESGSKEVNEKSEREGSLWQPVPPSTHTFPSPPPARGLEGTRYPWGYAVY